MTCTYDHYMTFMVPLFHYSNRVLHPYSPVRLKENPPAAGRRQEFLRVCAGYATMPASRKFRLADVMLCKEDDKKKSYPDFNWWNDTPQQKRTKFLRRDELPILKLPDAYPYCYSSAGPCSVGRTAKELDNFRITYKLFPKITIEDKLDVKMINQVRGYETTSMTASLQPFQPSHKVFEVGIASGIPANLNEPLYVPYQSHSNFQKYVVDILHPGWKNDPLYRRCIKFSFQESPEDSGPTEVSRR
ncbi:hypothetical protein Btru_064429 [Bulinus truncatus]|nr:hypothetical protein Btru_064429 [Bulinus truncatus]